MQRAEKRGNNYWQWRTAVNTFSPFFSELIYQLAWRVFLFIYSKHHVYIIKTGFSWFPGFSEISREYLRWAIPLFEPKKLNLLNDEVQLNVLLKIRLPVNEPTRASVRFFDLNSTATMRRR